MKKTTFYIIPLIVFGLILSCKKDDPEPDSNNNSSGNPDVVLSLLASSDSLDLAGTYQNSGYYEFGVNMKFEKAGKITQLGVKLPDDGSYTVTLWDLTDTSIVATATITADSGQTTYQSITPVDIANGDEYAVTVYSDDWYQYEYPQGGSIYPIDLGNMVITGYGYRTLATKTNSKDDFPDEPYDDYYAGIATVKFE